MFIWPNDALLYSKGNFIWEMRDYRALQLGPVSSVAPVDKLSVVLAMLLGVLILGEAATPRLVLGGVLIVAGVLLVALK